MVTEQNESLTTLHAITRFKLTIVTNIPFSQRLAIAKISLVIICR